MTEITREFVGLPSPAIGRAGAGGHPCQGIYHRPAGARPTTAFIATHYNVDFSEHYLASYLAERGFGFLGWNTRFRGNEAHFLLDHALAEIGVGVRWLREQAGVDRVVLLGNSGGGSLMAPTSRRRLSRTSRRSPGCGRSPPSRTCRQATCSWRTSRTPAGPRCSPTGSTRRSPTSATRCRWTRRSTRLTRITGRLTPRTSSAATCQLPAGLGRGHAVQPGNGDARPLPVAAQSCISSRGGASGTRRSASWLFGPREIPAPRAYL